MKTSEVIEGFTEFYVNDYFGYETVEFFNYELSSGTCLLRTQHFFSSLHVNDACEIVDMDNKKYNLRNHEQLFLFDDSDGED